jgi:hypothetical protein
MGFIGFMTDDGHVYGVNQLSKEIWGGHLGATRYKFDNLVAMLGMPAQISIVGSPFVLTTKAKVVEYSTAGHFLPPTNC